MLPVSLRYPLRQDSEFFKRAQAFRSPLFTLLAAPAQSQPELDGATVSLPRFAIIVKKTVAKGAQRSQIKRVLRSAIVEAMNSPLPDFNQSYAVVIMPTRRAMRAASADIVKELREALTTLPARFTSSRS